VSEDRVLRRISGPKREEITGGLRKTAQKFITRTLHQ
jgi:hypothetical protein